MVEKERVHEVPGKELRARLTVTFRFAVTFICSCTHTDQTHDRGRRHPALRARGDDVLI